MVKADKKEAHSDYLEKILLIATILLLVTVNVFLFYSFSRIDFFVFTAPAFETATSKKEIKEIIKSRELPRNADRNLRFLFFGDVMVDRHVGEKIDKYGFDYLLSGLSGEKKRFFRGVDVISANLEGAVTNGGKHYLPAMTYDFAFAPDVVARFKDYNFNFFNLANNHFADQGQEGIQETHKNLDKLNIAYSGCQDKKLGDCSAKIMNIAGGKVAFVGLSMVYGTFKQKQAENIVTALASTTDLVVVNIHWGSEYQHQFNKTQQIVAHGLIDAGADIIIGHHPHVVQGLEVYRGKPIFYSLGNFIFDQYFSPDTQEELAVGFSVAKNKAITASLFPLKSHASQPRLMDKEEKEKFIEKFIIWSQVDEKIAKQLEEFRWELIF